MTEQGKILRFGIIGAGSWAWEVASVLSSIRGVRIGAIANRTIEKARPLAERFRISRVFDDYRPVCELSELDGVLVLTHESAHLEPSLLALDAGKSVFLEKPMAETAASAREIANRARSTGRLLLPGHILRFESRCRAAKARLANAGPIRSIRCFQHRPKRAYETYCAPHIAFSLMIHHLDLCRWFAGSPVVFVESCERFHLGKDYPSHFWVTLGFESGCIANLESAWIFESDHPSFEEDGIEIITERERILLNWPSNGCEIRHGTALEKIDNSYGLALRTELEHWISCIGTTQVSPVISPEEGADAVALAECAVLSAKRSRASLPKEGLS